MGSAGGNISGGVVQIDCWDMTNNKVHLVDWPNGSGSFTGSTYGTFFTNAVWQADTTSYLANGVFNAAYPTIPGGSGFEAHYVNTTAVTGCGSANVLCGTPSTGHTVNQGFPGGSWTFTLGAGDQTAIGNGTLGLSFGMEQNPFGDGNDAFTIQLQGYWGTAAPSIRLAENFIGNFNSAAQVGDSSRLQCQVSISAGPNGHLYGLNLPTVSGAYGGQAGFNPPGSHRSDNHYTSYTSTAGTGQTLTDPNIMGSGGVYPAQPGVSAGASASAPFTGVLPLTMTTPPFQIVAGVGSVVKSASLTLTGPPNDPVSATVRIQRCWEGKAS